MDDEAFYLTVVEDVCYKDVPMPIVLDLETADDDVFNYTPSFVAEEVNYLDKYLTQVDGEEEIVELAEMQQQQEVSVKSKRKRANKNRTNETGKGFTCDICMKTYTCSNNLHNHRVYVHENRARKYKCDKCNHQFIFRMDLERHYAKHDKTKNYQCQKCGLCFGFQSSLSNHIRHHHTADEKKHKCLLCEATFGVLANLKRHEKVHLANRQCTDCGKVCQSEYHRKVHELTHMNGKCYNCPVCNIAFVRRTFLNKHMKLKHPKN